MASSLGGAGSGRGACGPPEGDSTMPSGSREAPRWRGPAAALSAAIGLGALGAGPSTAQVEVAVAAGGSHSCWLTSGGGVLCWGGNGLGQLGDGSITNRSLPVPVSGLSSGVAAIAAGSNHTCAVTTDGAALCWGSNARGQLGDGSTTNRSEPVAVSGLSSGVAAIAAGSSHTCALTVAGGIWCWGGNNSGQLGDGSTTDRSFPVEVTGLSSGVAAIAAGGAQTCPRTTGGAALCWGYNGLGQLGNGSMTSSSSPVAVLGLSSGVTAIATGGSHSCALVTGGAALCWGYNFAGQVGNGTLSAPVTAPV